MEVMNSGACQLPKIDSRGIYKSNKSHLLYSLYILYDMQLESFGHDVRPALLSRGLV